MSEEKNVISGDYVQKLRQLVELAEAGQEEDADRLLDEITKRRESSLFQELGKLTRQFHEALNTFRLDSRITSFAEKDFPDAKERLRYVVEMTASSADRSLNAAELSIPICESIETNAGELSAEWARFTSRDMSAEEFRELSTKLGEFLSRLAEDSSSLKTNLNEVIMAQDFQDLTGQVISRVIKLVEEMEESLVELIRISGAKLMPTRVDEAEKDRTKAVGPAVPGLDTEGIVSGQDEVDDLLSSLGF